jgi:hypothetical protein
LGRRNSKTDFLPEVAEAIRIITGPGGADQREATRLAQQRFMLASFDRAKSFVLRKHEMTGKRGKKLHILGAREDN